MPLVFTLVYAAIVAAAGAGFVYWTAARRKVCGPESPWILVGVFVILMGAILGILDRFIGHMTLFAGDEVMNTIVVAVSLPGGMIVARSVAAKTEEGTGGSR